MSDGSGNKPADDRTLLDPLSTDELKALREARARMQAKKEGGGSAVAHQIVIGPETGEDIGSAPTRAMPALPSFDSNVTLDSLNPPQVAQDPAVGGPPSQPMSMPGTAGAGETKPVVATPGAHPSDPAGPPPGKPTGFGENTLLWMQPPKPPPGAAVGGAVTPDVLPRASAKERAKSKIKAIGMGLILALVVGGVLYSTLNPTQRGVIELHTTPQAAAVTIDGTSSPEKTPVKLTLPEGEHQIGLALADHEPQTFTIVVKADDQLRKEIELEPISKPGLLTVSIAVQPVSAAITVDDKVYGGKQSLKLANMDPKAAHKILVEAPGYVKVEQAIQTGQLKPSYTFVLQKDDSVPQ